MANDDKEVCRVCERSKRTVDPFRFPDGEEWMVCAQCYRIIHELLYPELRIRRPENNLPILRVSPDWRPQEGRTRNFSTAPEIRLDVNHLQETARRNTRFSEISGGRPGLSEQSSTKRKYYKKGNHD